MIRHPPDMVKEIADLGGQTGKVHPELGKGAGPDQPGIRKLPREPLAVARFRRFVGVPDRERGREASR
jgi:hypothetical protein